MSDAASVVNEAPRLIARAKQNRITETFLQEALSRLQTATYPHETSRRRVIDHGPRTAALQILHLGS
jgi:hypothetical protein